MALLKRPTPDLGTESDVIGRRAVAVIIDVVLVNLIAGLVGELFLRGRSVMLGLVLGAVLIYGYGIFFEGAFGQTIGKMALGIVVVTTEGDHIGFKAATIRTVLRIVDVLPLFYLIGFLVIRSTDRDQRLGDVVANTVVVRTQ